MSRPEKKEHLFKILVIGELGTGKTSIIKRYVHKFFSQHYRATIGVDFALKVVQWDEATVVRLQLWDIAGQERFGNMLRVYYKEAVGAFIVFDVTRASTFEAVPKWKHDLDSKVQLSNGNPVPCVLLANKCDCDKEGVVNSSEQMNQFCKEQGFLSWFETSAKENLGIEDAAQHLVTQEFVAKQIILETRGFRPRSIGPTPKILESVGSTADEIKDENVIRLGSNPSGDNYGSSSDKKGKCC